MGGFGNDSESTNKHALPNRHKVGKEVSSHDHCTPIDHQERTGAAGICVPRKWRSHSHRTVGDVPWKTLNGASHSGSWYVLILPPKSSYSLGLE